MYSSSEIEWRKRHALQHHSKLWQVPREDNFIQMYFLDLLGFSPSPIFTTSKNFMLSFFLRHIIFQNCKATETLLRAWTSPDVNIHALVTMISLASSFRTSERTRYCIEGHYTPAYQQNNFSGIFIHKIYHCDCMTIWQNIDYNQWRKSASELPNLSSVAPVMNAPEKCLQQIACSPLTNCGNCVRNKLISWDYHSIVSSQRQKWQKPWLLFSCVIISP